MEAEI